MSKKSIIFASDMRNTLREKRDVDLLKAYEDIIHGTSLGRRFVRRSTVLTLLSEKEAPRFYMTPHMASLYVNAYYRGSLPYTSKIRQDMVEDLVQTYEKIKRRRKHMQQWEVWCRVVESPAKSFYLSKRTMMDIIFNYRKYEQEEK